MSEQDHGANSGLPKEPTANPSDYDQILGDITELLDAARRASARAVNSVMTNTYWQVGRRIVESEQKGAQRAEYGQQLIRGLARDLTTQFGRGFSKRNIDYMRSFYLQWASGSG